jgi:polyisoprenoid-binding protein YceI
MTQEAPMSSITTQTQADTIREGDATQTDTIGDGDAAAAGLGTLRGTRWRVDVDHTTVEFRVRHAGLAKVRGVFREFEGTLVVGEDGALSASGSVDVASLDTRIAARDEHLRSADFFDAPNHPKLTFATTAIEVDGDDVRAAGDVTIRGVTRPLELTGELLGTGVDDDGNERIGLSLSASLDRRDFGLTWNTKLTGGNMLVGNRVDIALEVSALKVAES